MAISWFPGHMLTARREVAASMAKIDVVIEVLDARLPRTSLNPFVETVRQKNQRLSLLLLNKADLADPKRTQQWLAHYNAIPGTKAVALSTKSPGEVGKVPAYCQALAPHRGTVEKNLRMIIVGIPNVGKSTLMNALLKRRISKVGDEPAITKHQIRHKIGTGMVLIDTPGMVWPEMPHLDALLLAATNSIGPNAYDEQEVAIGLGQILLADYRPLVADRYGEPPAGCDGHGLVAWVARSRGFLQKGGVPDLEKAARVLLHDFRGGAIGRITLETPATP